MKMSKETLLITLLILILYVPISTYADDADDTNDNIPTHQDECATALSWQKIKAGLREIKDRLTQSKTEPKKKIDEIRDEFTKIVTRHHNMSATDVARRLAERFNLSFLYTRQLVERFINERRLLVAAHLATPEQNPHLINPTVTKIIKMHKDGMSMSSISEKMHQHPDYVKRIIHSYAREEEKKRYSLSAFFERQRENISLSLKDRENISLGLKDEVIVSALQNSEEEAAKAFDVPILDLSNWVDYKIGMTIEEGNKFVTAIERAFFRRRIALINSSYWVIKYKANTSPNQAETNEAIIESMDTTITATAERLHTSREVLFSWLTNKYIQLDLMYAIVQKSKESTISDWVRNYITEMNQLQFPSQTVISLLEDSHKRYHAIDLVLKDGIEKAAKELDIPYSILSLLASWDHQKLELREAEYHSNFRRYAIRTTVRMVRRNGMTVEDVARILTIPKFILSHWLLYNINIGQQQYIEEMLHPSSDYWSFLEGMLKRFDDHQSLIARQTERQHPFSASNEDHTDTNSGRATTTNRPMNPMNPSLMMMMMDD